jgi:hypothetical protein
VGGLACFLDRDTQPLAHSPYDPVGVRARARRRHEIAPPTAPAVALRGEWQVNEGLVPVVEGGPCFAHHKHTCWTRIRLHNGEVCISAPSRALCRWFDEVLHNFPRLPLPEVELEGQEQEEIKSNAAAS